MSWPLVKLGEVCKFVRGPFGGALKKECFVEDGFAVYEQQHAIYNQFSEIRYFVDESKFNELKRFMLNPGDLIMSCSGTMGKIAIVPDNIKTGIINQALLKLTPSEAVDINYLKYWLESESFQFILNGMTHGAAIKNVASVAVLKEIEIPLPSIEEQKRIAAILDKADAIRRKRQQAIQLADDFLRSVFLDMFGSDLQRSTNVTTFGDVSILDAKMVDPREEEYLDLLHIGPDRIEKNTGKLLPALTAREEQLISKKFLFDNQYILYSKIRPYLRKVVVPDFKALCSADMYPIKPVKEKVTREFMWMLLLSDYFDNYVSSLPARANIPKLNRTELAAFKFSLPDLTKIEKFTAVVQKSHQGTKSIKSSYVESNNLFNSLSQKAFAGEL